MKILLEKLNANTVSLSSVEQATEVLRKLFLDTYRSSLLILDDVWSPQIIRAFDVCGRVLVTTQDISVMDAVNKDSTKVVKIEHGFTLEESLKLFSSYVNIDVEYLPEEAADIHNECKGSPLVISMIGGLISETGRHSQRQRQSGRWGYYLQSLKSRRFSKFKKQRSTLGPSSLTEAVMMSIENLDDRTKKLYKSLAVFIDDVGIPPKGKNGRRRSFRHSPWLASLSNAKKHRRRKGIKIGGIFSSDQNEELFHQYNYKQLHLPNQVLMTYWDMNKFEVEDVMDEFLKKSLTQSDFDVNLDSYVYHIHDLQLDYLKSQLDGESKDTDEKELHKHFLEQYFKQANFKYGNIVDDSYIFYNFGYHLFKSEQADLFPKIYLDLSFVEAMLKATSSVDLLNDYKRYGEQIIGPNDEYLQDLEEYEAFARTVGALVSNTAHTDIIQLALREPEDTAVYKAAKNLALQRPERLYFEWTNRNLSKSPHSATILHHGTVEAASFLPDITYILTTNGDGQLKVWDVRSGEVLHRFTGHKASVKSLAVSPDGDWFASGSDDGAIKIWDLGQFSPDAEADQEDRQAILRKGSVKGRSTMMKVHTKQTVNSLLMFDQATIRDLSNMSFRFNELHHEVVLCVAFDPWGEEVAAASHSGLVKVYNLRARSERLRLVGHEDAVNVCRFSPDGRTICTGSDDASVRIWDCEKGDFKASVNIHHLRVLDLAFVPHQNNPQKVVSMSADKLAMWDSPASSTKTHMDIVEFRRTRTADYSCMKVSSLGNLLAAGTVDNMITIWNLRSAEVVFSLPGHNDHIYVLDFTPEDDFLLSGSADETVMIWSLEQLIDDNDNDNNIEQEEEPPKQVMVPSLGPSYAHRFLPGCKSRLVAPDDANSVRVLDNGMPIHHSPPDLSLITCISLDDQGQIVAYGCENGSVRLYFPDSSAVKTLGVHDDKIKDVSVVSQVIGDLMMECAVVVSGAKDGSLKIWWDGGHAYTCKSKHDGPISQVEVFEKFVFSRSQKGRTILSKWCLNTGSHVDSFSLPVLSDSSTCMQICREKFCLALGTGSGQVHILDFTDDFRLVRTLQPETEFGPVRNLRFNPDGRILVTGHDNGTLETTGLYAATTKLARKSEQYREIQAWDLTNGSKLIQPLRVHESWVNDIQFSRDSNRMVTVGDKIAFWSLEHMTKSSKSSKISPNKVRRSSVTPGGSLFTRPRRERSDSESNICFNNSNRLSWLSNDSEGSSITSPRGTSGSSPTKFDMDGIKKVGNGKAKELLQIFDIRGTSVSKIFASDDFKSFVTIDDAGIIYILNEISILGQHNSPSSNSPTMKKPTEL